MFVRDAAVKSNDRTKYVELSVEGLRTRVRFPPAPPKSFQTASTFGNETPLGLALRVFFVANFPKRLQLQHPHPGGPLGVSRHPQKQQPPLSVAQDSTWLWPSCDAPPRGRSAPAPHTAAAARATCPCACIRCSRAARAGRARVGKASLPKFFIASAPLLSARPDGLNEEMPPDLTNCLIAINIVLWLTNKLILVQWGTGQSDATSPAAQ